MTKEFLEEFSIMYKNLSKSLEKIEEDIWELEQDKVSDSVTGSSTEFPFTPHPVKVTGLSISAQRELRKKREEKIHNKKQLDKMLKKFNYELKLFTPDSIDNANIIREMIIYRYKDGLSWREVSKKYHSLDESYSRNMINRYFEKHENKK